MAATRMIAIINTLFLVLLLGLVPSLWAAPSSALIWEASVEEAAAANPELRAARANPRFLVNARGTSVRNARSAEARHNAHI